jgi:hypothetical protein
MFGSAFFEKRFKKKGARITLILMTPSGLWMCRKATKN